MSYDFVRNAAFALSIVPFKSILAGQMKLQCPQPSQRFACNFLQVSKSSLSNACLTRIGLKCRQQDRMHAPHRIQSVTLTAVNCLAFGSFGVIFSVLGFIFPTLSNSGEVKFIMTNARIEPPKKFMYVWISTVNTPK